MAYPTANPAAKHDLLCSNSIIEAIHQPSSASAAPGGDTIETIEALTSSIVQSAIPLPKLPPDIVRLATIYTYPDAPTKPKPLSRSPRVWRLASRSLFDQSINNGGTHNGNGASNNLVQKCNIAVKLPTHIPQNDVKSHKNSKLFHNFIHYLHAQNQVAILACDSAGRVGFVVPIEEAADEEQETSYAAYFYYAPMKEFIPWARDNYASALESLQQQQQQHSNGGQHMLASGDEPGTWTPQYAPPPEEECKPRGWDDHQLLEEGGEPETWTPQYTPPPEEECGPRGWEDHKQNNGFDENGNTDGLFVPQQEDNDGTSGLFVPPGGGEDDNTGLFVPPGGEDDAAGLFVPPGASNDTGNNDDGGGWDTTTWGNNNDNNNQNTDASASGDTTGLGGWAAVDNSNKGMKDDGQFHANEGAAAADAFYSGLTRSLDTRANSRLYHMRSFNGWVKATQIAELDPDTSRTSAASSGGKKRSRVSPLRILDLACGKGGDLGKWTIHQRKIENYVGVDVARGSLVDAAIRARQMSKRNKSTLKRCTFSLADLGEDVPGRKRSNKAKSMQKLLTWNMENETTEERSYDPVFVAKEGGGIAETDRFDVVSIQFAIHYMMQTRKRARRFFHTVSSLLEIGGNLIATTIDARVVVEKLMGLGLDYHFDELDGHVDVDKPENEERHHHGNRRRKVTDEKEGPAATVAVGHGVCRLKFDAGTLHKVFQPPKSSEDMFGLQYTFTLVEGSDHASGVGEAVDLPEWLTPIPALEELAEESGLKLEYATNFHEFFEERKNPAKFPMAHNALYNMKVLNRNGSISAQEWEVSRMYIALKFRKVKESNVDLGDEDVGEDEMKE